MTTLRYIEYIAIDDIQPSDLNPKRHDIDELKKSFRRYGFTESGFLDERTGKIVAGHGRKEALQEMRSEDEDPPDGITEDWKMPITRSWSSANDNEAGGYLITSNRLPEIGGWDNTELLAILDAQDDLDGIGYSQEQLQELVKAQFEQDKTTSSNSLPFEKPPTICPECGHSWVKE